MENHFELPINWITGIGNSNFPYPKMIYGYWSIDLQISEIQITGIDKCRMNVHFTPHSVGAKGGGGWGGGVWWGGGKYVSYLVHWNRYNIYSWCNERNSHVELPFLRPCSIRPELRAVTRFATSQSEMTSQSSAVCFHWLGAKLESALRNETGFIILCLFRPDFLKPNLNSWSPEITLGADSHWILRWRTATDNCQWKPRIICFIFTIPSMIWPWKVIKKIEQ